MMELMNIVLFFSEASESTWRSKVYDHFNITLRREVDDHQKPKKLVFVFTCKVDPINHTPHVRPRTSIGHGTKNLQDGVRSCNKRLGVAAGAVSVQPAGEPYTPAGHRTLIALRCAKNHRPFNSVLDDDYQAEVEMLRPRTIIPSPQTVSRDIKAMYVEMSKHVRNYFMVCHLYICMVLLLLNNI
jgi:hypothetical protein